MAKYNDDFRAELKKGFLDAIGKMTDYRIRINAAGWVDKEGLTQDDYLEICHAVEAQYIVPEPPVVEDIPTEETEDETILDGEEETETEVEESKTETEIIEDSTNEEVIDESTNETPEAEPTEPTE